MKTTMLPVAGSDIGSPGTDQGCFAGVLLGLDVGLCVGAAGGAYHLITTSHTATPTAIDALAQNIANALTRAPHVGAKDDTNGIPK
jgi:hypothetical protein